MPQRPNILLLSLDALRYDAVGANGNPLAITPNMDAIAAGGTRFRRAYCSHATCAPSRASIMTGKYPTSHGVWTNGIPLNESETTLAELLTESGYSTYCYGKAHWRPWMPNFEPQDEQLVEYGGAGPYYGFQHVAIVDHSNHGPFGEWVRKNHPDCVEKALHPFRERPDKTPPQKSWKSSCPPEATKTDFIAERTIETIRSHGGENGDDPFFIWASFIDPHIPWAPPRPFADLYDDVEFPPPIGLEGMPADKPSHLQRQAAKDPQRVHDQWLQCRRMYQGKVSHVDDRIGRMLAELEAQGLADNTVVILLADHGILLGEYTMLSGGSIPLEAASHIPMIWRVPGEAGGREPGGLASVIDVMPTLLEMAGVEVPDGVQGQSLVPMLTGQTETIRDELLVEGARESQSGGTDRYKTILTDRYKLSLFADPDEGELYDMQNDPEERCNLFDRPEAAEVRNELIARLARLVFRSQGHLPPRLAPW